MHFGHIAGLIKSHHVRPVHFRWAEAALARGSGRDEVSGRYVCSLKTSFRHGGGSNLKLETLRSTYMQCISTQMYYISRKEGCLIAVRDLEGSDSPWLPKTLLGGQDFQLGRPPPQWKSYFQLRSDAYSPGVLISTAKLTTQRPVHTPHTA